MDLLDRLRAPGARETRPTRSVAGPLFGGSGWPESALQTALADRLRRGFGDRGSPLFAFSWCYTDPGFGPRILRCSATSTRDGVYPWPAVLVAPGSYYRPHTLRKRVQEARDGDHFGIGLTEAAQLAGYANLDLLTDDLIRSRGPLNPDLPRWMMGFPEVWSELASE